MRWPWSDDGIHRQADELRARNAQLHAENGQMRESIDELRQQVAGLQQQIIDDSHSIIDHFAMRATNSPVFTPPLATGPMPNYQQAPARPRMEDIAEQETRKFFSNHRIAGLGLPLNDQSAPAEEVAQNEQ